MSDFWSLLDEYVGDADALDDINVVVRRCWFYDFVGHPVHIWQGQGTLITTDGVEETEWLGTVDSAGVDKHNTPPIQDGRDGTSASYTLSMDIPSVEIYNELKADQSLAAGRSVTCYLAIFRTDIDEALRPSTPIIFFRELKMQPPKFSERLERDSGGKLINKYRVSVVAKDNNSGRSNIPNGTYTDTIQKERARQNGVALDRGCEYVASLAYRTMQVP